MSATATRLILVLGVKVGAVTVPLNVALPVERVIVNASPRLPPASL